LGSFLQGNNIIMRVSLYNKYYQGAWNASDLMTLFKLFYRNQWQERSWCVFS